MNHPLRASSTATAHEESFNYFAKFVAHPENGLAEAFAWITVLRQQQRREGFYC